MIGIGLVGLGTVGTGVAKILRAQEKLISSRVNEEVRIVKAADKVVRPRPECNLSEKDIFPDYKQLLKDPKIDIIVELIGGYEPARTIILDALHAGKHVVTANKAVLAKYWGEIFTLAKKKGKLVYFEAAVGGGIPVIQGLHEGMAGNSIEKIIGILNGTTNFVLTRMAEDRISFAAALKLAQQSGFAEADPTFDIQGVDSAHKIAILASLAFDGWVKISDVYAEGIANLDLMDLELAQREFGYGLKLLGIAKRVDGKIEVRVHPTFLPEDHPFLTVKNEYNAVSIWGDAVSDLMFYGKGAGQMAAASAVVSDIIYVARQISVGTAGKLPEVVYDAKRSVKLAKKVDFESQYYLRFTTIDELGVLAKISMILGRHKVSIASVYQPQSRKKTERNHSPATILLTTHSAREGAVLRAIKEIDSNKFIKAKTVLIRIEE